MKKYLFLLVETLSMGILLLFSLIVIFSFKVSAQALPEVSSNTFSVLQGGAENISQIGFQSVGVTPYPKYLDPLNQFNWIFEMVHEYSVAYDFDVNDVSVYDVPEDVKTALQSLNANLTNSNGQLVSIDDCYYLEYDNGFFSGYGLIDSNGDLVNINNSPYSTIRLGGFSFLSDNWSEFYASVKAKLNQYAFVYPGEQFENLDFNEYSAFYHYICGTKFHDL